MKEINSQDWCGFFGKMSQNIHYFSKHFCLFCLALFFIFSLMGEDAVPAIKYDAWVFRFLQFMIWTVLQPRIFVNTNVKNRLFHLG